MARKCEVAVLTGVFVIIAGCFSIPVIIYYAASSQDIGTDAAIKRLEELFNTNECPQELIADDTVVESTYNENCSWYEGICSAYLKPANNNLTVIGNSAIVEQQLSAFFHNLEDFSSLISEECSVVVMPFVCQYVYPPCDGNGNAKFITQEECINIRDEVCVPEWRFAMAMNLGSLLPVCEVNINNSISLIEEEVVTISKCHYQFKEFCGVCLPLCATFSQYTDRVRINEDIVLITSIILTVIGGIVVLTVAAIRRKKMLVYPQVLAMYTTINILLFEVFLLISFIGREGNILCSHEMLHLSILHPTVYSQIAGFVSHFALVCATVTWFLHLSHLFLVVSFPFWSKFLSEKKWKIRLHVVEVFGSVVLCSIAPITFISVSEYRIFRFPPLFTRPSRDATFYSIVLPNVALIAVGVNLTIYTFISIRKNVHLHKRGKTCLVFFSVPEFKILVLLSYYTFFGIVQLINATITINENAAYRDDLFKYLGCQLTGYDPVCEEFRRQSEKHLKPGLNGVSYSLFTFVTWVNLLFAIEGEDVKWLIQKATSYYHFIVKAPIHKGLSSN